MDYRLLNIPASKSMKSFQTKSYQLILVSNLFLKSSYQPGAHIGSSWKFSFLPGPGSLLWSKAEVWLVCGRCILGIETNMALLLNWYSASSPYQASTGVWRSWYYLMSLQGRFWYEVGIASDHTNMMSSLVSGPVLVHIPCQLGTRSTPISTNVVWN
jgi:hypothetical protein